MNTGSNKGFTIIELVMVIVIVGLLASVATPKFAGLEENARTAAFDGVKGGFTAAVRIAHAKWLVEGSKDPTITIEGSTTLCMGDTVGWPTLDPNGTCTGQTTASGLYSLLMTSALPGMWTTATTGSTTARYCLAGTGGNNFLYTVATGVVADDPNGTCP